MSKRSNKRSPSQLDRDRRRAERLAFFENLSIITDQLDSVDLEDLKDILSDCEEILATWELSREEFVLLESFLEAFC